MNKIQVMMRDDWLYLSSLQQQITQTEGEPEADQLFDWDNGKGEMEDESYITPEQLAAYERLVNHGYEDDDEQ